MGGALFFIVLVVAMYWLAMNTGNTKKREETMTHPAPRVKNEFAKTRKVNEPYEVWVGELFGGPLEYRVLKKNQVDDDKPYAIWFVAAKSPATHGSYDMGDTYVKDIKDSSTKVAHEVNGVLVEVDDPDSAVTLEQW